jgi:serine/threonine protein kinase/Tfp pilus assembly protein PilF
MSEGIMTESRDAVADTNPLEAPTLLEMTGSAAALFTPAGRYEIQGEIARGGMGIIYRAIDSVLGREVALKLLQERFAPDSSAARRFVDEARIAGQLQHPGIPAIHDLGALPDGRPFLAMKLIKGRTLHDLLRDGVPGATNLVAVFEQACQAVGYAHAHKVVHRDLKPANIMVGAFGEVQVMDWGLAKVLTNAAPDTLPDPAAVTLATEIRSARQADSPYTQAGSVLGTPAFMPPEQAIGAVDKIDERSDVFGLGAILCAILTGRPPYVASDSETTRQLAARGKLEEAYQRLEKCDAEPELAALCKRCLSPEKVDRPADAGEVARSVAALRAAADERARLAELDRVRAEGVRAKAELQAAEQRHRRKVLALAATVVIAALAIAAGVSFWQAHVAHREAENARAAEETAREETVNARKAESAATAARAAEEQERKTADETINFLKHVLAFGTSAGQGGKDPKKNPTVREALDWAAQSIAERLKDQPQVEAKVRKIVGEVYYGLQSYTEAAPQYERRLEILEATLGPDDEGTWAAMNDLGETYKRAKRYDEAEKLLKAALASKRAKLGNDNRSTQRTVNNLGGLYRDTNRYDEAEPLLREAYETRRRVLGPDDPDSLNGTNNLGALYFKRGKPAEAEPYFREAAEGFQRTRGILFATAQCWSNVGDSILAQERYADAVPEYMRALSILDQIPPEEGRNLRPQIAGQLVKVYTALGKPEEAARWAALAPKPMPPPAGETKKPE